jgi:hypothetical protein
MSSGQGGSRIIWNISNLLSGYVAPHPRRQPSPYEFTIFCYALKVKYIWGYKQTWVLLFETCKTDHKGKSQTFIYHMQKQNRDSLHSQAHQLGQQRHKCNKVTTINKWVQHILETYSINKIYLIWHSEDRASWYNNNQWDALILNFILVKNSTCFWQISCPLSGVLILYSQQ